MAWRTWRYWTYVSLVNMDSDDLLLMYLPYCIYKKIITPLDELIADNQQLFAEFGLDNDGLILFIMLLCE